MYYYLLRIPGNTGRFYLDFLIVCEVDANEDDVAFALAVKYRQRLMDYLKFDTYGSGLTLRNYIQRIGNNYTEANLRALTDNFQNDPRRFVITKEDIQSSRKYKPRNYKEAKDIVSYISDKLEFMSVKESARDDVEIRAGVFSEEFVLSGRLRRKIQESLHPILTGLNFKTSESGLIWNNYWIGFDRGTHYYLEPNRKRKNPPGKVVKLKEGKKIVFKPYKQGVLENNGKKLLRVEESAYIVEDRNDNLEMLNLKGNKEKSLRDGDVVIIIGITNPRWCGKVGIWTKGGVVFTDENEVLKPLPNDVVKIGRVARKNVEEETGGGDVGITTNDITSGAIPGVITTPTKMLKFKNKSGTILNIFYADKKGNRSLAGITKRGKRRYKVITTKENSDGKITIVKDYTTLKRALQAVINDIGRVNEEESVWPVGESVVVGYKNGEKILWREGWGQKIDDEMVRILPVEYTGRRVNVVMLTDIGLVELVGLTESSIVTDKGAVPLTFLNNAITMDDIDLENAKTLVVREEIKGILLMPDGQEKHNEKIPKGRYTAIPSKDKTTTYIVSREQKKVYKVQSGDYKNYINSATISEQMIGNRAEIDELQKEIEKAYKKDQVDKTKAVVEAIRRVGYDVPEEYFASLAPSKADYIRYNIVKNYTPYEPVKIVDGKGEILAIAAFVGTVGVDKVEVIVLEPYTTHMKAGEKLILRSENITK